MSTQRRDELLSMIRQRGYLSVSDTAVELGVDASTVRRDLARLAELNLVERSHGGALLVRDETELPYDVKIERQVPEKRAIAKLVASLIPDEASVILDSGSTAFMVAQELSSCPGMTVVTPDVRVAAELIFRPHTRVIVPGGESVEGASTLVSQDAVESIRRFHVDFAVIGTDAVDHDGASNMNGFVVPLKRAMIDAARHAMVVADHSKFGVRKLMRIAPLEDFDEIISDTRLDEATADSYPIPVRRAVVENGGESSR